MTLSMDRELIGFAHKLAEETGDSISNMVAAFLRRARKREQEYVPRHPVVRSLYGSARGAALPRDKKAMREVLLRKHLA